MIDSHELTDITNDMQAFRPGHEAVEETHILQQYQEPFLDTLFEVTAECMQDTYERNQQVYESRGRMNFGTATGHSRHVYSFQIAQRRFTDVFSLSDRVTHFNFRKYMDMELSVTGEQNYARDPVPSSNQKSLTDGVLTSQLRQHIIQKSQSVLDQIGRLHLPVQNAQLQWIITRGKIDKWSAISSVDENQLPPGTLTLVDMANVSFKLDAVTVTKSTQMRINGILFDAFQPRSRSAAHGRGPRQPNY